MAQIHKADGIIDWLDQRLAVKPLMKVLMTEYWIPKKYQFPLGNGCCFGSIIQSFSGFWIIFVNVLQARY